MVRLWASALPHSKTVALTWGQGRWRREPVAPPTLGRCGCSRSCEGNEFKIEERVKECAACGCGRVGSGSSTDVLLSRDSYTSSPPSRTQRAIVDKSLYSSPDWELGTRRLSRIYWPARGEAYAPFSQVGFHAHRCLKNKSTKHPVDVLVVQKDHGILAQACTVGGWRGPQRVRHASCRRLVLRALGGRRPRFDELWACGTHHLSRSRRPR
jgi:hypothetical protein